MDMKTFAVERWMNTYENDAVYNLAETDAKPFTLSELLSLGNKDDLIEELMKIKLGYNPTTGRQELREVIAGFYKDTARKNILVTTGAIEADFLVTNTLVKPGDTVIVHFPAYQALYSTAEARGARVKYWYMKIDKGMNPILTN